MIHDFWIQLSWTWEFIPPQYCWVSLGSLLWFRGMVCLFREKVCLSNFQPADLLELSGFLGYHARYLQGIIILLSNRVPPCLLSLVGGVACGQNWTSTGSQECLKNRTDLLCSVRVKILYRRRDYFFFRNKKKVGNLTITTASRSEIAQLRCRWMCIEYQCFEHICLETFYFYYFICAWNNI